MSHLKEDQFIDVLMGEPHPATWDEHLRACRSCTAEMKQLRKGLARAKVAAPHIPDVSPHVISHRIFRRRVLGTRLAWVAAAAMFFFSILGLRLELNEGNLALQFSLLGGQSAAERRLEEMETRLLEAIEIKTELTQRQMDQRFDIIFQERDHDLHQFSNALQTKFHDMELNNATYLAAFKDEVLADDRLMELKGKLK